MMRSSTFLLWVVTFVVASLSFRSTALAQCGPATVSTFPYIEDFDTTTTQLVQSAADQWDWTLDNNGTPSVGTGPSDDVTFGAGGGGNYMFFETSVPVALGDEAILESPCIDVSSLNQPFIEFYYHMWGAAMGTLTLEIYDGTVWTPVWSLTGDQGNQWHQGFAFLDAFPSALQYRFVGIRANDFTSDMAIDNIIVREAPVWADLTIAQVVSPTAACGLGNAEPVTLAVANIANDTVFGVDVGFQLDANPGNVATLPDTILPGDTLFYTFTATVDLSTSGSYSLATWAVSASDTVTSNDTIVTLLNVPVTVNTFPYLEDFEGGLGLLSQSTTDGMNWTLDNNGTPSIATGPTDDHTLGAGGGGFYIYTEASGFNNLEAEIESPCLDVSALSNPYIKFWYHMLGNQIGSLELEILDSAGVWNSIWILNGAQGNQWLSADLPLGAYGDNIRYRFTGTTGPGFESDIALDDIRVYNNVPYDDLEMSAILEPVDDCYLDSSEAVTVEITNVSTNTINTWDVNYWLDSTTLVTETVAWPLLPDSSYIYTFATGADLSAVGTHSIWAWTSLGTDTLTFNDSLLIFVTKDAPVDTFPYLEDFDGTGGMLMQSANDDIDWTLDNNGTPSVGTGPSDDHTFGAGGGGSYWYTEASGFVNSLASMNSPCLMIDSMNNPTLEFWYHMWGAAMGQLQVDIYDGTSWTTVWTVVGDQGDQWFKAEIDLLPFQGNLIQYRFNGTTGNLFTSDIAVDDILVYDQIPFDDVSVTALTAPLDACGLSAAETITVEISNLGTDTMTGFDINYQIDANPVVTETVGLIIPNGGTQSFSFATTGDFSANGVYTITVWTSAATDTLYFNDTLVAQVTVEIPGALPIQADFTGYTGDNINIIYPGWREAFGTSPNGTNAWWDDRTGLDAVGNITAFVNLFDVTKDEWIITPKITPDSNTVVGYKCAVTDAGSISAPDTMGSDDRFIVFYSTDCGVTWNPLDTVDQSDNLPPTLTQFFTPLGSLAGTDINLGFFITDGTVNDPQNYDFHLDDINIYNFEDFDAAALSVNNPVSGCVPNDSISIEIGLANLGANAITGFTVSYQIDTFPVVSEVFTDTLLSNTTGTYTFNALEDFSNPSLYNISVWVTLAGDSNNVNDTIIHIADLQGSIAQFPYVEDFDFNPTQLIQSTSDGMDWLVDNNGTPSANTGPSDDVTLGVGGGGNYLYTEASGVGFPNITAIVESPCIDITGLSDPAIEFSYHMFGALMGTLDLQIFNQGVWTSIWSLSGDQGNQWHDTTLSLSAFSGSIKYRFFGTTGTGFTSDMAIDDIIVFNDILYIDGGVETLIGPLGGGCQFGTGEQIIINMANIGSDTITDFVLNYQIAGNTNIVSDTITGQTIASGGGYFHIFTQTADLSGFSYAADINIWAEITGDTVAWNDTLYATVFLDTTITTFPYVENFDSLGGYLTQSQNDQFDWTTDNNGTPSTGTGPANDVTLGVGGGGFYSYTESSTPRVQGDRAVMASPCIDLSALTLPAMDWWFHMEGAAMGTMYLELFSQAAGNWDTVWTASGDSGAAWHYMQIDLMPWSNQTIRYRFTGEVGTSFTSDMALDEIRIFELPPFDDVGVNELLLPQPGSVVCVTGDSIPVALSFFSNGDSLTNVTINYVVNGVDTITELFTDTVLFGDTMQYLFNTPLAIDTAGTYNITMWTSYATDTLFGNDTVSASFTASLTPLFELGNDTTVCPGDTVTLDAGSGPGWTYQWSTTAQSQTISPTTAGIYTVLVSDPNGCFSADSIAIFAHSLPTVNLGPDTVVCDTNAANLNMVLDAGIQENYLWSTGATTQTITVTQVGTYSVEVNFCGVFSDTVNVTLDTCLGMSDFEQRLALELFPNPTNGIVTITAAQLPGTNNQLIVTGVDGKTIRTERLVAGSGQFVHTLNLNGLSRGIYFVKLLLDDEVVVRKVVLQ